MSSLLLSDDDVACVTETAGYSLVLLGILLASYLFQLDINLSCILVTSLMLLLVLLSWWRFEGGRHPCFLFLVMLLLFQCGRMLGLMAGLIDQPMQIVVQTPYPIDVGRSTSLIVLAIIAVSGYCVYLPCRWRFRTVAANSAAISPWLGSAYCIFAVTFPFLLLKNYLYLQYIRLHGGYLAVFTDNAGVIDSVNPLIRVLSLIAYNIFFVIAVLERRPRRLLLTTILFISCSALELLIGFRGKVFLLLLTLWYLSKWKSGKPFRLVPLLVIGLVLSAAAPLIATFRENQTYSSLNPLMFVVSQGVSLGVTESAVEYRHLFEPHALGYFFHSMQMGYRAAADFPQGQIFDNDLSIFLNRQTFLLGYATGSSYLAEAYLFGGIWFVIVASILVGLCLRWVHRASRTNAGALLLVVLMPGLLYLPRNGLAQPIVAAIKSAVTMVPVLALMMAIRHRWQLLGLLKRARSAGMD